MNANAGIKVDKATFFRFIERQAEGRFEYDRGHIVQLMSGGTLRHASIIKRLEVALDRQLDSLATSEDIDLVIKPREYLSLPSLVAYIVASQNNPHLTVWLRDNDGGFPAEPNVVEGPDAVLAIDALGIDISLAEIYRRMTST